MEGGAQPPSGPNWTRGAAPLSFFLSPSFLLSYSNKEGGESYSRWEEDSSWRAPPGRPNPSPWLLYIWGQGGTSRHNNTS